MKKKKKMLEQYKVWIWSVVGIVVCILIGGLLSGCTTTKYVPVESSHTEHHWHTDSVIERDTTYHEIITTIMQLDSAEMARYGITLKQAERAWLVKSKELERQIQQLMQLSQQKDTVRDSIPVPYEVTKEVPAKLSWWQQTRLHMGEALLAVIAILLVWGIFRIFKMFSII